jgi:hypothetical protein
MPPSEKSARKKEIDWELQAANWRVVSYARWSKGDHAAAGAEGRSGHPRTAAGGAVGWREIGALGVIGERQARSGCGECLPVQHPHVDEFAAHVTRACHAATNIEPQVYAVQAAPLYT